MLGLAIGMGPAIWAESPGIRITAPSLGWVLSPDGTQVTEIAGVAASPRAGRELALPAAARRSWASPDAAAVLVQTENGIFLVRESGAPQSILELSGPAEFSAAWDRAAAGFALCGPESCQSFDPAGAIRASWDVEAGARALAYSAESGLVISLNGAAQWLRADGRAPLDGSPIAAAFRPGTSEAWFLDAEGRLTGQDFLGRRTGEGQVIENALGLVASRDGRAFFAASETAAAVFLIESQKTESVEIGEPVEGVWAAPGAFSIRLHDSAKRPIAIWDGESGALGWMPAVEVAVEVTEVNQ